VAVNTPVKHDLTAAVRLGLEEHGIHVRVRLDTRSFGLHELRPSHLAAVSRDTGVVRHVLRL
jgi:hypothetical protein